MKRKITALGAILLIFCLLFGMTAIAAENTDQKSESLTPTGIGAPMFLVREPYQVRRAVVGAVAVQVVALVAILTLPDPCKSHEQVTEPSPSETAHLRVVGMHVRLASEVPVVVALHRVQSSRREGVEQSLLRAIEFG